MEVPTRYTKSADGTNIAYAVIGEGEPVIAASMAWGDLHLYRSGFRNMSAMYSSWAGAGLKVTLYDGRGFGSSFPAGHAGAAAFRTVLFTDIVGHTEMMRRLGDARGRDVLREHETLTRRVLQEHGGSEVKTMGDGFLASFPSVTRAVECAVALQRAIAERNESADEPLAVRVGLNAGEPIEEDGDLFGETVILASRIAAMAGGSEILASLAVRELCAGKGFAFSDLGEHAMRGFEDPVRVFAIKWRD